jgi:hypothetical protein
MVELDSFSANALFFFLLEPIAVGECKGQESHVPKLLLIG